MGRNTDEDEVIFPPPDLDLPDLDLTSGLVSSVFCVLEPVGQSHSLLFSLLSLLFSLFSLRQDERSKGAENSSKIGRVVADAVKGEIRSTQLRTT